MLLPNFRFGIVLRFALLAGNLAALGLAVLYGGQYLLAVALGGLLCYQFGELFSFIDKTNRKLVRFLESIRYADFTSGFASDDRLGGSFHELNRAFTEVMEAFRRTRAEKEEHWQYLHTVVQHINTGLVSFDTEGRIEIINNTARRFLGASQLHNINDLGRPNPALHQAITGLQPGQSTMFRQGPDLHFAINATELKLREKAYRIISIQNIQSELQQKEIEAWQNLSKVLRHEIMNSVTPISSLVTTLNEILTYDLSRENGHYTMPLETADDLREGLSTIESRSKALIKFVNTYRNFTNIPQPHFELVKVRDLFDRVSALMSVDMREAGIAFLCREEAPGLELSIDAELIEMVLINLLKNAMEAPRGPVAPHRIQLRSSQTYDHHVVIEVEDNGQGIIPEAIDKIFIPFFTTKAEGSGIGLSWSRQIMQLHRGTLTVQSQAGGPTVFVMRF